MSTTEWLHTSLQFTEQGKIINRLGRNWTSIAGFSSCGCIFAIYKDENNYCVHVGEEWGENEEPLLGYYSNKLAWNELISEITNKYDALRQH